MLTDLFIHIHLPRTGGSTLRTFIGEIPGVSVIDDRAHLSYSEMAQQCQHIPPAFVFIRNPWDWYVSQWCWVCQVNKQGFHGDFREFMKIVKENSIDNWNFKPLSYAWEYLGATNAQYIGRFENLHDETVRILLSIIPSLITEEQIRSGIAKAGKVKQGLDADGKPHAPYWEYYDGETRYWVARWDAKLIKRFGYAPNNPNCL